jgi:dipeptidyl-peptidase 4
MKHLIFIFLILCTLTSITNAQGNLVWAKDSTSYFVLEQSRIMKYTLPDNSKEVIMEKEKFVSSGSNAAMEIKGFQFSADEKKILLFTNTIKVWRYETKGDYWVYDISKNSLIKLGTTLPVSSMMFAKFSPDGGQVAYVSKNNLYVEKIGTYKPKALTKDGSRKIINGTFDWAYEEEFDCRDGFRWSPNSKQIAYWQIIANDTKDYLMINNYDSIYPSIIPVEYPVAGEKPSSFKIGVVDIYSSATKWMKIPTDPVLETYLTRMEWAPNATELIVQQLNRKQNQSDIRLCDVKTGGSKIIYTEKDNAWIDIMSNWDSDYANGGWDWMDDGNAFLWASEKDGWRHLYKISKDGKQEMLITKGDYDVIDLIRIDKKNEQIYFLASPNNATQKYLYRTALNGNGSLELLSPANQIGTHGYVISPNMKYARHSFSNHYTPASREWITLKDYNSLDGKNVIEKAVASAKVTKSSVEFFKVTTSENITMDGWMVKPTNFDSTKKYPIVFMVYTEPAGANVKDQAGAGFNRMYRGNMADDGYIYVTIDNRGTPVPKGREWRKSIYRKIGIVNIKDQAMAAKEVLKWSYVDTSRVAVWGWSGGGSATLNLMFQYPEIYKTGISIAAVANQLTYDNIYQERFMGLPQENKIDFVNGSPLTYAKNLRGNLLYIHGTGDDNVHYNNAEMLINELVKHDKQFQLMSYPGRSHSISEGAGTSLHLQKLYTEYLKKYCPPGAR